MRVSKVAKIDNQAKQESSLSEIKTINPEAKVRFSEMIESQSHLYKLVEADVIKYIGKGTDKEKYPESSPDEFLEMGHAHVFRTLDSDGAKHTRSVPIGGHYHLLELEHDPKDPSKPPKIVKMSGPMHLVTKRVKGKVVQVDEPLNQYDFHTHDVAYIKSEKIQARATNKDAVTYMANEAAKTPSPPSGAAQAGGR